MEKTTNKYLIGALIIGIAFHGTSIFFTLETTYDALIHLFFAEHYASHWFESWNLKWYTGFTVMGYPPLVHQAIGLLSYIGGLKFGLFTVAILSVILFITGVYRFSLTFLGHRNAAGYAALFAVFSSSFLETLHIFGQLPSVIGVSVLMHAMPEIYLWIKTNRIKYLLTSLSLLAVTVTSHHVTPIFGMVFFIFPLIGMVLMDAALEKTGDREKITLIVFFKVFITHFKRIVYFGILSLILIIGCILPYWVNTKNNPITQVPIPHGSRDNFIEVTSSGLVFFLIPWGILLFFLPYFFYRFFSKRYLFYGLSFSLLTLLGTGGTTPLPKMILGNNAFNILTLDRFTLWASIMALPVFGEFLYRMVEGDLKYKIQERFGKIYHRLLGGFIISGILFMIVFTMSLGYFRPTQPQKIKMLPILNFLHQDQHDQWRFLPLGFGDQMAWLSAQTNAMTVDGNYHSARRLPELTTKAVERLENSKFRGIEGLGSLQQFLTVPEKYNLKYVFSNDKFYDPILYFCGWQRLRQLENGIMVWEKLNVPPLSSILNKEEASLFLRLLWGIVPILTVVIAFVINIQMIWIRSLKVGKMVPSAYLKFSLTYKNHFSKSVILISHIWALLILIVLIFSSYHVYLTSTAQVSPENVIKAYYDALDFKEYKRAYSYLNPETDKTLDQYMLEIAVTDGLLSSYAKLDEIQIQVLEHKDSVVKLKADTYWVTPLKKVKKTFYHEAIETNDTWYLEPSTIDLDLPPDQLYTENISKYYNHGRRRITSEQTYHEDVLKQPVLEVLNAKVVKMDTVYSIVGTLQNIDNVPADVVLQGTLYDQNNTELAKYSAKDIVKHKLLPKEQTNFRIDFEEIAWIDKNEKAPETFNPEQFTPMQFTNTPTSFNLQCAGNVANSDLYKGVGIQDLIVENDVLKGVLFNSGIQEVTVPQLIISFYTKDGNLLWVVHQYLLEGIRQQRKQYFEYQLPELPKPELITTDMKNVFVNGVSNDMIKNSIIKNRSSSLDRSEWIKVDHQDYEFIQIEINNYIGAPF